MSVVDAPAVACVRCAVAAAHPYGHYAGTCPNCGRERER